MRWLVPVKGLCAVVVAWLVVLPIMLAAPLGGAEWAHPAALLLLIPVLALAFRHLLAPRRALPVARVARRRWSLRLLLAWVPQVLLLAGLILMVLALARPRLPQAELLVESEGLDMFLVLDLSGSMRAEDFHDGQRPLNRVEVAKAVAADFIEQRTYDRLGLVVFGAEVYTHVPLTLDHDMLLQALDQAQIGNLVQPRGTAIGDAIGAALNRLSATESEEPVIILLTDGIHNAGRLEPLEATEAARALGARIYTVGIGRRPTGIRALLGDEIDEPQLIQIAEMTGAEYFRATDVETFRDIYDKIDQLETSPAEVRELVAHEELYRYLLVPGLLLIVLEMGLSATWLRRGP